MKGGGKERESEFIMSPACSVGVHICQHVHISVFMCVHACVCVQLFYRQPWQREVENPELFSEHVWNLQLSKHRQARIRSCTVHTLTWTSMCAYMWKTPVTFIEGNNRATTGQRAKSISKLSVCVSASTPANWSCRSWLGNMAFYDFQLNRPVEREVSMMVVCNVTALPVLVRVKSVTNMLKPYIFGLQISNLQRSGASEMRRKCGKWWPVDVCVFHSGSQICCPTLFIIILSCPVHGSTTSKPEVHVLLEYFSFSLTLY